MTKKSEARLARDRVQAQAQQQGIRGVYDTLNHLHQQQFNLFKQYRDMVAILASDGVDPWIQNRPRVETLVNTLDVDMGDLMNKTATTFKQHQGKTGFAKPDDEDEYLFTMQLEHEYIVYMGVHQQILIPILLELDEHMHAALRARQATANEAQAAAAALDNQPLVQVPAETPVTAVPNNTPSYEQPAIEIK